MFQCNTRLLRSAAILVAGTLVSGMTQTAAAQSDKTFTYQGVLKVDGTTPPSSFAFAIFDLYRTETGGTRIARVFGSGGGGNVLLGDSGQFVSELNFGETGSDGLPILDGGDLYLEVSMNSQVLTPRQRITATPIALSMPGAYSNGIQFRVGEGFDLVRIGDATTPTDLDIQNGDITLSDGDINMPNGNVSVLQGDINVHEGSLSVLNGGICIDTDGLCIPVPGGIRVGIGGILGTNLTGDHVLINPNGEGFVGIGTSSPTERLDVAGAIRIRGADIVEGFGSSTGEVIESGTVVSIDPTPGHEGQLMPSSEAYDTKVAGVVSGAGGLPYGMSLAYDGQFDGDTKVAMTGRVYVKCSAENGVIRPGDLLTTASLAGHAMKATHGDHAHGTVIGKAMSVLEGETGLVLVLVNLQ